MDPVPRAPSAHRRSYPCFDARVDAFLEAFSRPAKVAASDLQCKNAECLADRRSCFYQGAVSDHLHRDLDDLAAMALANYLILEARNLCCLLEQSMEHWRQS